MLLFNNNFAKVFWLPLQRCCLSVQRCAVFHWFWFETLSKDGCSN